MEMLAAIFTAGIIVAGAFLIWLKTKSGKKWLALDIYRVIIGGISTIIFIRIGNTILK